VDLAALSPTTASIIAGSIAGSIGVGVAFPLDTLKTKSQVMSVDGGMFDLIYAIYASEGIGGFFGGVRGMMVGQGLIKAVAFGANGFMLGEISRSYPAFSSFWTLAFAALFAGFIASFVVAPFERIKVMMQASDAYDGEIHALRAVLDAEGWEGLMSRGLGPTLAREIPSYGIYFVTYGLLMATRPIEALGAVAPLIAGAAAGCACWLPVYPIDVVKTLVQNTEGGDATVSSFGVARDLFGREGLGGFFDGLTPKMYRAMVNHATTFWLYDLLIQFANGANIIA